MTQEKKEIMRVLVDLACLSVVAVFVLVFAVFLVLDVSNYVNEKNNIKLLPQFILSFVRLVGGLWLYWVVKISFRKKNRERGEIV